MPITLTNREQPADTNTDALSCAHCGDPCGEETITAGDHTFCCVGCQTVYDILHTHDLTAYYDLAPRPGISLRGRRSERYAWLDDEETAAKLIDFRNERLTKVRLQLPQIHCASCIWLLENIHRLREGVLSAKVNFLKKEAIITFDHQQLSLRQLVELLALIGYAPTLHLGNLDARAAPSPTVDRRFVYQLGVAGFAFGNIMLLSFPEYLGLAEGAFQRWFGYLNILLALPVLLFSGRDYFSGAWFGLRQRRLIMDLPIALGMLALFGRSVYEILSHSGAGYLDSLAGLVFFLLIGRWFQQKTYQQLSFERDYKAYFPVAAGLKTEDGERSVPLDKLAPGDTVIVRHQELIPADGVLIHGRAAIDYSFVTGEAEPVQVDNGATIFAGGRQTGEAIEVTLTKKVSQSYLTQLWNEAAFQQPTAATTSRLADRVSRRFTLTILLVSTATLAYWLPRDVATAVNAFTAVLIIACPCALALSIPFTLGNALRLLTRQGFYIKNTQVIENLAAIDTVVFDKTGTLTAAGAGELHYEGAELSPQEQQAVRALARQSGHPISRRIDRFFRELPPVPVTDFRETPGRGLEGLANGLRVVLEKCPTGTAVLIDGRQRGVFLGQSQYRPGLDAVLAAWRDKFPLYVLSGDNERDQHRLADHFPADHLHFHQSPRDKLRFIERLQADRRRVLMLGDGLNDAGALQQSDAGIVIADNANNFTPACDAILDAQSFARLPRLLAFANTSVRLVHVGYGLAFVYNVVGLSFAVQGLLSPVIAAILMPLSSVTIAAFGVVATQVASWRAKQF